MPELASSLYNVVTEIFARIEEGIAKQKLILLDLRENWNTFHSPIFRLPAETLTIIFVHCARDSFDSRHSESQVPGWVNVSHVCRYWRNVALNCPTPWTYIWVMAPRWTDALLARSKQAPLKIKAKLLFSRPGSAGLRFLEKVMEHSERIQSFSLCLASNDYLQLFSKISSRAPRLQYLEIWMQNPYRKQTLPFQGDTPSLRTLELSRCPVPWYLFKLNGLTTLSLREVPLHLRQNVAKFLPVLSRMPDLTNLYLDDAFTGTRESISSWALDARQKINLPHLSRFLVIAPVSTVVALLSCVDIPSKTELRLKCCSDCDSSLDDYTPLYSLLAQRFDMFEDQGLPNPTIRSMFMNTEDSGNCLERRINFGTLERNCDNSDFTYDPDVCWGSNSPLGVIVEINQSMALRGDGERLKSDICCSLPLGNVRSLHVNGPPISAAFWREILGHLQGLRYLKLSYGCMPDLASVLSLSSHDDAENQGRNAVSSQYRDHMIAPALEELELEDIIFTSENPDESCGKCIEDAAITQRVLFDALSTRKNPGGRLSMIGCDADDLPDAVWSWDGTLVHVMNYEWWSDTSESDDD